MESVFAEYNGCAGLSTAWAVTAGRPGSAARIAERAEPDYLVGELSAADRAVSAQMHTLPRGGTAAQTPGENGGLSRVTSFSASPFGGMAAVPELRKDLPAL